MKKPYRILCIDILNHAIAFQESYPHLGFGYIIAFLTRSMPDIEVRVIDRDYIRHFSQFRPDLVAISSVTQNYHYAIQCAQELKKANPVTPIIIGGIHVSQLPQSLNPAFDIGVIGEGEETFLELVKHLRISPQYQKGLEKIKGITFLKDGVIIRTEPRPEITSLDLIPHPARQLLPHSEYQLLLTSRGCPYQCAFCASAHYWQKVRYFSTEYVLDEISRIIREFPVFNLFIFDDLFVFNKQRLADISEGVVRAGFHKRISFWCTARANHIDEESISLLTKMNVKGVGMGLESGSDRVLKSLKGPTVSVEINRRAIALCKKNGLFIHGSFMLGCPTETDADMRATADFVRTSGIDKGDITVATPLPGTQFWQYALREGLASDSMDWSRLAYRYTDDMPTLDNHILLSKEVSRERFVRLFREIAAVLIEKRKAYEARWSLAQGASISWPMLMSLYALKKIIRDPRRALRYFWSFIISIPVRFSVMFKNRQVT